ncbi:MAG TPA: cell division protein FtsZ [Verrucomicrobia bacterium]|jgi:cell division protein FtsZ|nr:cell division protein FtsZ [Verrucomicrobiota bacterium]
MYTFDGVNEARRDREREECMVRVLGVGGAGCNAVNRLAMESNERIGTVAINMDGQVLASSLADRKVQIGKQINNGLGAGGDVVKGQKAAMSDILLIEEAIEGADIVFIVVGLGGGTGTGAAPEVIRAARNAGALVLVFATLPFRFEDPKRMVKARQGFNTIQELADAVFMVPNDRWVDMVGTGATVLEAFRTIDDLMAQCVRSLFRIITATGIINLDFGDLRAVLHNAGQCAFGTGLAEGEGRAAAATEMALGGPLLRKGFPLQTAGSLMVHIMGGPDLALTQIEEVMDTIRQKASAQAQISFGACVDEGFQNRILVTLIATDTAPVDIPLSHLDRAKEKNALASDRGIVENVALTPPPGTVSSSRGRLQKMAPHPAKVLNQELLPLEQPSHGIFDPGDPTTYNDQNLDLPTYLRRNIALSRKNGLSEADS